MIEIIAIKERKENQVDTDKLFYIENGEGKTSMTEKYNYAIENIVLTHNDDIVCFRHEDSEIRTPMDVCEYKLKHLFEDKKIGCAGLIGTIQLENSCTWWNPNRDVNGVGSIIQGGIQQKVENGKPVMDDDGRQVYEKIEYPMNDFPGIHDYMATVDGCCMFFPKRVFVDGLRFDENLKEYHFYDCDICLQLLEKGYKITTTDIVVKHQSSGVPSPNFRELGQVFFNKWNAKVHGQWPISRLSKFYPIEEQVKTKNEEVKSLHQN